MITITMNDDFSLTSNSNVIPAQYSENIKFNFEVLPIYKDSLIVPGYMHYDGCTKVESAVDNYSNGEFTISANAFSNEGMLAIAFAITTGEETVTTTTVEFEVRGSVNTSFYLPKTEVWQNMLQNFMDQYMDKVYSYEIRILIDKAKELQANGEILQELINIAITNCGQYKFENGQLFFRHADGTYGEGINLNVSVEEFENVVRRVTKLETNKIVTEPTLESCSNINVPTIKAVVDGLGKRQLLINNDFLCNQRGKNKYEIVNTTKYTVDMWVVNSLTVELLDNGSIKLTNNDTDRHSIFQRINLINSTYTFCVNVVEKTSTENIEYPFQLIYWDENLSQINGRVIDHVGIISETINTGLKQIGVAVPPGCTITLEYVDLFEGKVAYPHVKKDYTTALMKCQRYLKILNLNWAGYITTAITQQTHVFEIPMIGTPTVSLKEGKTVISTIRHSVSKDRIVWSLYNSTAGNGYAYDYIYTLSCEPL